MSLADMLKEPLSLTDDQIAKIKPIDDELSAERQKLRDDMQNGGDRAQMGEKMQALFKTASEKVRPILTDEQKTKFDDLVKNFQNGFGRGGPGGGGGFGGGRGPNDKDLADRAEKELTLSAEEKSAVMPLVKTLLEAKTALRDGNRKRRDDLQKFLKDVPGTTDAQKDEISAKLKEMRKAADTEAAKVKQAQEALREVLTSDNEAKLIAMGVIDWTAASNP